MKFKRRMLWKILLDALIIIIAVTIILGYRAISPPRMPVLITPTDLGLPYEKVNFITEDEKNLSGWFIQSKEAKGVIICLHGYPANKSDILPFVEFLYPCFSLFLFDFRAHGESSGKITHFGLKEHLDVYAAIKWLRMNKKTKNANIGIWGYSLGGAVGIIAADGNNEIKALVTDSAFANFPEMVTNYYKNFGPLKYVFSGTSRILGRWVLRSDFSLNSPETRISGIKCPILIIHSEDDEFVPFQHAKRLFEKAPEPKELFITHGSHTAMAGTTEYQKKVLNFFKKYIDGRKK
ncbi:MAG: alpha/beta fold hydrolase [Candidatus Omnitrophica bacterium]|nr:alpha/beta fold hydrolase [Candidatus Omnitrophota bacterium]MCM8828036.1 alpha/beta fold hydrolase [Candidatus Omnitrophota bacterium]